MTLSLRIGTRRSTMALAQTEDIARPLNAAALERPVEIVKFAPVGDRDQNSNPLRHGGKGGACAGEIRAAMLFGKLQAAMHSLKGRRSNHWTHPAPTMTV